MPMLPNRDRSKSWLAWAVLCAAIWVGEAAADTVIGNGIIASDTVWDLAGSPYILGVVRVAGTDGAEARNQQVGRYYGDSSAG